MEGILENGLGDLFGGYCEPDGAIFGIFSGSANPTPNPCPGFCPFTPALIIEPESVDSSPRKAGLQEGTAC